ncbi:MAG TPA: HEAT repeat domain-containing protein [Gaiellaceae bacterium]
MQHWLRDATTPAEQEAVLRRLPRRTLTGIASDARVDRAISAAAALILFQRRPALLLQRASAHRNEAEKWRRIATLRIVALADRETALPILRRALSDADEDVVGAAVRLLGEEQSDDALALLVESLADGRYPRSQIAAYLDTERAAPHLLPLVDHPADDVRFWAASLLRPSALDAELALAGLAADPSPRVRAAVLKSFAAVGGGASAAIGRDLIHDPTWFVRAQAARAIGSGGNPELVHRLVPLLRDEQWWVRTAAKEALAELGPSAEHVLVPMLRDDDAFARNGAAEVLLETGAVARWAAKAADEPDDEPLSVMIGAALRAGGDRVQQAALAAVTGRTRQKLARLIEQMPDSTST